MDAASNEFRQGRTRLRIAVTVAVLFALGTIEDASAQLEVYPVDGSARIAHNLTNSPQAFPPAQWEIENRDFRNGCVVQWTLTAFTHESIPSTQVDADVKVTLIRSGIGNRWNVVRMYDATNLSVGKSTASVEIASSKRGKGAAALAVQFIQPNITTIPAGKYHTTLTGTITGL